MPLRCRVFGHRWGLWISGSWHEPNFGATAGSMLHAHCKRCPARYRDALREEQRG